MSCWVNESPGKLPILGSRFFGRAEACGLVGIRGASVKTGKQHLEFTEADRKPSGGIDNLPVLPASVTPPSLQNSFRFRRNGHIAAGRASPPFPAI